MESISSAGPAAITSHSGYSVATCSSISSASSVYLYPSTFSHRTVSFVVRRSSATQLSTMLRNFFPNMVPLPTRTETPALDIGSLLSSRLVLLIRGRSEATCPTRSRDSTYSAIRATSFHASDPVRSLSVFLSITEKKRVPPKYCSIRRSDSRTGLLWANIASGLLSTRTPATPKMPTTTITPTRPIHRGDSNISFRYHEGAVCFVVSRVLAAFTL